jgi:DNA-binding response OmpR family regulator
MEQATTILLVEDSPTQAKQLAADLESEMAHIIIADDGPAALQMAYEHQPQVIVLDINLPSMSGYQVCRRLKLDKDTTHIPVIMLTSADSSDNMMSGIEAGAEDYIPKDEFAVENLLNTLTAMGFI